MRFLLLAVLAALSLDAALSVPAALAPKEPVLVDMLRGGVYAVDSCGREDRDPPAGCRATYTNLPLVDYPLLLADRSAVKLAESL